MVPWGQQSAARQPRGRLHSVRMRFAEFMCEARPSHCSASTNQDICVPRGVPPMLPGAPSVLPGAPSVLPDARRMLPGAWPCTQFSTAWCFPMHASCFRVHDAVLNSVHLGTSGCMRSAPGSTALYSIQDTRVLPGARRVLPGARPVLPGACGLLPEAPRCTQFRTPGCFRVHGASFRVHSGCFRVHDAYFRVLDACFAVYRL